MEEERTPAPAAGGEQRSVAGLARLSRGFRWHPAHPVILKYSRPADDLGKAEVPSASEPPSPSKITSNPDFIAAVRRIELDQVAVAIARRLVEDVLVEMRDNRDSALSARNGFVIREADGTDSSAIRLTTTDGLAIGIKAYLAALGHGALETSDSTEEP